MNVASLSLCKELYQRSGWKETDYFYQFIEYSDLSTGYYLINPVLETPLHANAYPAYDLGFLLRRLPRQAWQKDFYLMVSDSEWVAGYDSKHPTGYPRSVLAKTPEDAACKLAIELFRQDVFKASVVQGFMTHSITTEELDRVDECMDMLFTDINLIVPNEALIGPVGLQSQMQIKKAVKEDYRKLSEAIQALRSPE